MNKSGCRAPASLFRLPLEWLPEPHISGVTVSISLYSRVKIKAQMCYYIIPTLQTVINNLVASRAFWAARRTNGDNGQQPTMVFTDNYFQPLQPIGDATGLTMDKVRAPACVLQTVLLRLFCGS